MKSTPHTNRWRRALAAGVLVILVPAALAVHQNASEPHSSSAAPPPPSVISPAPAPDTGSDAIDPAPSAGSDDQPADSADADIESSHVLPENSGSSDSNPDTDTTTDDTDPADATPGYLDPGETSKICAGGAVCDPTTALPYFQPGGGLTIPND
jgi:hypothetical protein